MLLEHGRLFMPLHVRSRAEKERQAEQKAAGAASAASLSSKSIPKSEQEAHYRKAFHAADADGSGEIDASEFSHVLIALGHDVDESRAHLPYTN